MTVEREALRGGEAVRLSESLSRSPVDADLFLTADSSLVIGLIRYLTLLSHPDAFSSL